MLTRYRGMWIAICFSFRVALLFAASCELASAADQVVQVYNPAGVRADGAYVDKLLKQVMTAVGKKRPALAGEFREGRVEGIPVTRDAFEEINELFYKRGWGDGLPIVPPTEERVKEMLKGTDRSPDEVVSVVAPKGGQATVEKIAVNAVMAGCLPEYMPVLIASVQAITEPGFNLAQVATTTGQDSPLVIVSGPIAKQLDINAGSNALGRGWRANASIGRALHMIINNIGGSWPGVNDMSTLGHPGEFANCLAEIEEGNPWGPLRVELGYSKEANVVTVVAAEGFQAVVGLGLTSKQLLDLLSNRLVGLQNTYMPALLLILNYDTVDILKGDGWTRESIRKYIDEHARMPFSEYKKRFIDTGRAQMVPESVLKTEDPNAMIPVPTIGQLLILVAGGPPGEKDMIVPVWPGSKAVSKEIRLPNNWEEMLQKAKK